MLTCTHNATKSTLHTYFCAKGQNFGKPCYLKCHFSIVGVCTPCGVTIFRYVQLLLIIGKISVKMVNLKINAPRILFILGYQ